MANNNNNQNDLVGELKKTEIFSYGFSEDLLAALVKVLRKDTFTSGQVFIEAGQPQTFAFYLSSGNIVRTREKQQIDVKQPGAFVGLRHLFEKGPAYATMTANSNGVMWVLTYESLFQLFKDTPDFQLAMLNSLAHLSRSQTKTIRSLNPSSSTFQVAFFDSKSFWKEPFARALAKFGNPCSITYLEHKLNSQTVPVGYQAICIFVNDRVDDQVVSRLRQEGVKLIALRCAGFNNVDRVRAQALGIPIVRVPAYSPYAVAEHSVALLMGLNRKTHTAFNRVREGNFSLNGLVGFDIYGKTVGLFGTGKIGRCALNIWKGLGCRVLLHDLYPSKDLECENVKYVSFEEMLKESDIVTLHCPLTPETQGLFNKDTFAKMKQGAYLINTSRGALIKTTDLIETLKCGKLRGVAMDVYENETKYFFEDLSNDIVIEDPVLAQLTSFKNVLITGHQAFLTNEALQNIADTTIQNIVDFQNSKLGESKNVVTPETF